MGQFSWMYADTGKQMVDGAYKKSYLLVPEPFQEALHAKYFCTQCYDGYGHFGARDVYDLVADWNREAIPDFMKRIREPHQGFTPGPGDLANLMAFYEGRPISCEKRWIGIMLACGDENNSKLPYPIKITEQELEYTKTRYPYSKRDKNQGW